MTTESAELQPISLPDDMQDWAQDNAPMISRLSAAIHQKPDMSEKAIWGMIASEVSPEWSHAKSSLKSAEKQMRFVHAPENMPLGLIGSALHSEETNSAQRDLAMALAGFTIIDETLRQQEDLTKLLRAVRMHQHTISQSLEISLNVADVTVAFAAVAPAPEKAAPGAFVRNAVRRLPLKVQNGKLSLSFRSTQNLKSRTATALLSAKKQPRPQTVS